MTSDSIEAVLFDLDGVLWQSNEAHHLALREVASSHGLRAPDYGLLAGRSTEDAFRTILLHNGCADVPVPLTWITTKQRISLRLLESVELSECLPGTLHDLSGQVPVALVTGASPASVDVFLDRIGPSPFSVVIHGGLDLESKPSPVPFLAASEALDVPARNCLVFEDSDAGMRAALSAGMQLVHVRRPDERCEEEHQQFVSCVSRVTDGLRDVGLL